MTPAELLDVALRQAEGLPPDEAAATLRAVAAKLRAWRPSAPVELFGFTIPAPWQAIGARALASEAEHRASVIEETCGLTSAVPD